MNARRSRHYHERTLPEDALSVALTSVCRTLPDASPPTFYVALTDSGNVTHTSTRAAWEDIARIANLTGHYIGVNFTIPAGQVELVITLDARSTQVSIAAPDLPAVDACFAAFESMLDLTPLLSKQPHLAVPSPWVRVDRALLKAHQALAGGKEPEDYQAVGLLCREVLISLAQVVYDPIRHPISDVSVSPADAGRMLEAFFAAELRGGQNEDARRHARSALTLAVNLQHRRTATHTDGRLCLAATSSIVWLATITSPTV